MKNLVIIIILLISAKGLAQKNNIINENLTDTSFKEFYNLKAPNKSSTSRIYVCAKRSLNNESKDIEKFVLLSKQEDKLINAKINEYNFAVFDTNLNLTTKLLVKFEFHIDKYNTKMALLNMHIPLKI